MNLYWCKVRIVDNRNNHRELRDLIVNHRNLILVSGVDDPLVGKSDKVFTDFKQTRESISSRIYDSKRLKKRRR